MNNQFALVVIATLSIIVFFTIMELRDIEKRISVIEKAAHKTIKIYKTSGKVV